MSGLSGLANFGFFAGGVAKGYEVSQEQRRKNEEHEWRKEEQDRDKVLRESVAKAQGLDVRTVQDAPPNMGDGLGDMPQAAPVTRYQVGDQTFDQRPTDEQVQGLRSSATAKAYRTAGKVSEAETMDTGRVNRKSAGLKIKAQERENAQGDISDQILTLRRRLAAGDDPSAVFEEVRKLNSGLPNGFGSAFVESPDGAHQAVVFDEKTGRGTLHPINADTVAKALDAAYASSSPANFQHSQELGLKDRQARAAETTAGAAKQKADTDAGLAPAHAKYYKDAGDAALINARRERGGGGASSPGARLQMMKDEVEAYSGALVASGRAKNKEEADRLAWGAVLKDPSSRQQEDPIESALIKAIEGGKEGALENYNKYVGDKKKFDRIRGAFGEGPGGQPMGPVAPAGPRELTPGQAFRGAVGNSFSPSSGLRGLMGNREYDPNEQAPY